MSAHGPARGSAAGGAALPTCAACGAALEGAAVAVRGYSDGTTCDVRACRACGTSSADPGDVDLGWLYEAIYVHAARLPGYSRYVQYAADVAAASDALALLAGREEIYRAVGEALGAVGDPSRARVLEVGSGLGYLTFALRQRGFQATGIDLSAHAVAAARARFGPHYECVTLRDRARAADERFDFVVMTELIEHVADPLTLLRDARALLSEGGRIVLTTPSRDAYAADATWRTEQPPVHLHWFSGAGLARLAARAGLSCEPVAASAVTVSIAMSEAGDRPPVLARDGRPWRPSLAARLLARVRRVRRGSRAAAPETVRGATLAAVLAPVGAG